VPAQIDSSSEVELLATVCSVLLLTYSETEVQHWFCPPVAQEADALLRARVAGWLGHNEFEEAILQLFVLSIRAEELDRLFADDSATPAALTTKSPSPAGCPSGGLGAQDATASARVTEYLCVPSPTP